ncbi:diguanylate cyclase domain-containing protein [Heyndrickxia sporothermodurans]
MSNDEELKVLKQALEQSFMIVEIDYSGKITYVNENFCKVSKYSSEEILLQNYWILSSGYHSQDFFEKIWETITRGKKWTGEICSRAKNREIYWVKTTIIPFKDKNKGSYRFLAILIDITDKKKSREWMYMAFHDELTGLPNRRMLNLCYDSYILKATYRQTKFAVLFMDINNFKNINDSYGHLIGDEFLRKVGNRLSSIFSKKDCVFRLGGDEFIIILDDIRNLEKKMHSILSLFVDPFILDSYTFYASVSVGVSIYPDHSSKKDTLMNYANKAMFKSKQNHGNNYQIYQLNGGGNNNE